MTVDGVEFESDGGVVSQDVMVAGRAATRTGALRSGAQRSGAQRFGARSSGAHDAGTSLRRAHRWLSVSFLAGALSLVACGDDDATGEDGGGPDTGTTDLGHDLGVDQGGDMAECPDRDGDGHHDVACGGDDCDDADGNRYPGNAEVCDYDGHDEDCDEATFGDKDVDRDGFVDVRCCNGTGPTARCGEDCDDTRRGTNPLVPEVCNGRDDDCNGLVDDGDVTVSAWVDADRDGDGDPGMMTMVCAGRPGFSNRDGDCNDDPMRGGRFASSAYPEVAGDGIDNDCDGLVDEADARPARWYRDRDGDGFGDRDASVDSTGVVAGHVLVAGDCDDDDEFRSPGARELCNGLDDDCDGQANFALGVNDFEDDDGDGFVDAACPGGGGRRDCDDRDPATHPGALELCDGRDNDCDGMVDEMCGAAPPDAGVDMAAPPPVDAGPPPDDAGPPTDMGIDGPDDAGPPPVDAGLPPSDMGIDATTGRDMSVDAGPLRDSSVDALGSDPPCTPCEDAGCFDLSSDPNNCGGCGNACSPGSTCRSGMCGPEFRIVGITAGFGFTCGLLDDATVACWGRNHEGQRGTGSLRNSYRIRELILPGRTVSAVEAGSRHACAIVLPAGQLFCWGNNCGGQVGDGTTALATSPSAVSAISNVTSISAGDLHTCALLADGTVRCWGWNGDGQLGHGVTELARSTPTAVPGITGARSVATGHGHSCVVLDSGRVLCWGRNDHGQLGDGTARDSSEPVVVTGVETATTVVAGSHHTCALLEDGNITCWGRNADGQLGDGTRIDRRAPSPVMSRGTRFAGLTAGDAHTCAVSLEDLAFCWGANESGQLGDGDGTGRTEPTPVSTLPAVTQVAAGSSHTCAMDGSGRAWCWGSNRDGQLGIGTTVASTTPRQVITR
jgi:alpha-tubulin suppressor-like RCC1 family protein